ncbi:U2 small nuclear ribonucleoprotein A'-like [Hydractinia symbiolongicarpus]|uniref:U2 small nuclear ribonucleoprotein A'-like n=1 Tax=Hydractinia symbiolongicarpus TaxID=13093 RepID=UPI0025515B53|nr:U2 small nuclear ribonucleoprotein A'-like [Hydractinia symbiolongicarpus]
MVKLTADLIEQSPQYTNPLRDREIDLRGYKISVIENLGATLDQFDCIDFSDNDIKKLEGFPLLKRLKMILLNNNRVCRFEEHLEECLPQLETLVLTNNNVQELADVDPLASVKSLSNICFLRNPVANKPNYRYYLIYKLPQVRVIDFQRVRMKERAAAKKLFSGAKGEMLKKDIAAKRNKTFEVKDIVTANAEDEKFLAEKYKDQEAIKAAIGNASTLEEVRKLELLLQQGHIPGKTVNGHTEDDITEVEMEED